MIQYIQNRNTLSILIRHSENCDAPVLEDEVVLLEIEGDETAALWLHSRFCLGAFTSPWLRATTKLLQHIIS